MFCDPATEVDLTNIIAKLNNNKAAGPDNIGPALLKEIAPGILHQFLHIVNLSFSTGVFCPPGCADPVSYTHLTLPTIYSV